MTKYYTKTISATDALKGAVPTWASKQDLNYCPPDKIEKEMQLLGQQHYFEINGQSVGVVTPRVTCVYKAENNGLPILQDVIIGPDKYNQGAAMVSARRVQSMMIDRCAGLIAPVLETPKAEVQAVLNEQFPREYYYVTTANPIDVLNGRLPEHPTTECAVFDNKDEALKYRDEKQAALTVTTGHQSEVYDLMLPHVTVVYTVTASYDTAHDFEAQSGKLNSNHVTYIDMVIGDKEYEVPQKIRPFAYDKLTRQIAEDWAKLGGNPDRTYALLDKIREAYPFHSYKYYVVPVSQADILRGALQKYPDELPKETYKTYAEAREAAMSSTATCKMAIGDITYELPAVSLIYTVPKDFNGTALDDQHTAYINVAFGADALHPAMVFGVEEERVSSPWYFDSKDINNTVGDVKHVVDNNAFRMTERNLRGRIDDLITQNAFIVVAEKEPTIINERTDIEQSPEAPASEEMPDEEYPDDVPPDDDIYGAIGDMDEVFPYR